jgi:hypothetical protein
VSLISNKLEFKERTFKLTKWISLMQVNWFFDNILKLEKAS